MFPVYVNTMLIDVLVTAEIRCFKLLAHMLNERHSPLKFIVPKLNLPGTFFQLSLLLPT